jgi:hypothetical protein
MHLLGSRSISNAFSSRAWSLIITRKLVKRRTWPESGIFIPPTVQVDPCRGPGTPRGVGISILSRRRSPVEVVKKSLNEQKHLAQRRRGRKETKGVVYSESQRLCAKLFIFSQLCRQEGG